LAYYVRVRSGEQVGLLVESCASDQC
jgi:hypothetical protein